MKKSTLITFICSLLSMAVSSSADPHRARARRISKRFNPTGAPANSLPLTLTYDITPPLLGSLCNSTWNGGIVLNSLPARANISEKCKQIYDAIAPSTLWLGHQVVNVEWVWICPTDHIGTVPPPPKDGEKPYPAKFTIVGADFPPDKHVTMARLDFTVASHKPPIEVDNVQVQVEYDVLRAPPRQVVLVTRLICM